MWYFRRKPRGEKIRDPIQGAFFSTEAIAGPAQALVRESVQNSIDAREGRSPVRVRFRIADGEHALAPAQAERFFRGAWEHYAARGNGLNAAPTPQSPCAFLTVEDFGTRGLTGDPAQAFPESGKNPFFLFFRAEGLSAKSGSELGRWGVGKFVFPRSSLASTHFGLTMRADDRAELLMGAVTLKTHRIGGETFSPDALYGRVTAGDAEEFVLPVKDREAIEDFRRTFSLSRTREPGLSVVVPFLDPDITFDSLLLASVRNWFWPLLSGDLRIEVESPEQTVQLSAESFEETLRALEERVGSDVLGNVSLARWGRACGDADRVLLRGPDPVRAVRWSADLVPPDAARIIRDRLEAREPVAVRVPLSVRPKHMSDPIATSFEIYLQPDRRSDGRPVFLREGILVSDVRGGVAPEVRALVCADDKPLATLLGDCESPAHTEWQKDSPALRYQYTYGKAVLEFVTSGVKQLLSIVSRGASQQDPSLTVDFFSIDAPPEEADPIEGIDRRRPRTTPGGETPPPQPPGQPLPQPVVVSRSSGGFTVTGGSSAPPVPCLIELRCAYNLRTGNPLRKWSAADFELGRAPVRIECDAGVAVQAARGNWLLLRVSAPEFRATVTGFDEARDLYVRYQIREKEDDAGP